MAIALHKRKKKNIWTLFLTLSQTVFLKKGFQPPSAFLVIFTKFSWPLEYFVIVVILYEYLNMQYIKRKNRPSAFKQQQKIYSSFMHSVCIITWMWVSFIKKQHFEQKAEKNHVFVKDYIHIWFRMMIKTE